MPASFSMKTVLVTGATSGIGYQAALDFARNGAFVIGAGRDPARCRHAAEAIRQAVHGAAVEFLIADLASQQQVRSLAAQALSLLSSRGIAQLDVLVNNAGLYSSAKKMTEDDIELTFAVNHLAPFLLTHLLLPALVVSPDCRILNLSSESHYHSMFNPVNMNNPRFYVGIFAYATSNLSRVLFSAEFNRRVPFANLHAWAVDPGLVNTEIGLKDRGFLSNLVWRSRKTHGTTADAPSRTILHLAFAPLNKISNNLYWKDSRPKPPSRASRNSNLARRLWEKSCRLCEIDNYFVDEETGLITRAT